MYIDYYPVSSNTSTTTLVTPLQLATYIATEWRPAIPASFINSFLDVINIAFERLTINGSQYWGANPDLALTDRQWSGVTSWMMGVAFTRFIIEEENYPWWSPVSAFKGTDSTGKTTTGSWPPFMPRSYFTIQRTSGLLPDYLVCKLNNNNTFEFAFVESKATNANIAPPRKIPAKWSAQSKSANLLFGSIKANIARHLVIATRVNPHGKRSTTRKVVVRAWNDNNQTENTDTAMIAYFLASHYAFVCGKIGYTRFSELMSLIAIRIITNPGSADPLVNEQIEKEFHRELNILRNPQAFSTRLDARVGPYIVDEPNTLLNIILGNSIFTARLTRSAMQIMGAVVFSNSDQLIPTVLEILKGVEDLRQALQQQPTTPLAVMLNGVTIFNRDLFR
jgi:hypothetical protein